jgi:hypothetical protein
MFRKGVVEARVDQEVSEVGMVHPMHQHGEIARHVIAVGLLGACGVEVETCIHVDDAGLKGRQGDVTRMRHDIIPVCECGGRNPIRHTFESTKSTAQQVGSRGESGQNQNGGRAAEFPNPPHVDSYRIRSRHPRSRPAGPPSVRVCPVEPAIIRLSAGVRMKTLAVPLVLVLWANTKEQIDHYFEINRPYDAIRYVPFAAPTPLLFQFARHERFVTEAAMKRYAEAASEPKLVLWYDTGHELNDLRALADRTAWLGPKLGLRPLGALLKQRIESDVR